MEEEPVIVVAELARRVKSALSGLSQREWIEGEITSLRRASSGHLYFSLKDPREAAVLDAVMYRADAARSWRHIEEGALVQVQAKPDFWVPRGRLQLVIQRLRPAGRGAQLEALERLKLKLAAEGLFDPKRKRRLPDAPRVIGVVTSEHGAAIHDLIRVAFRRGAVHLVLAPAIVQGEQAVPSLLRALDLIERHPQLDVLIIGRGGGSGEDLIAFNQEALVRRLSKFRVPVVSAVGHEIDLSLTDLVADIRAATPSEAAELVVADQASRHQALKAGRRQLTQAMRLRVADDRATLERLRSRLGDPRAFIRAHQQLLDDLELRLKNQIKIHLESATRRLQALDRQLLRSDPKAKLAQNQALLLRLHQRLLRQFQKQLSGKQQQQQQLERALRKFPNRLEKQAALQLRLSTRLHDLSPHRVLDRGYAIITQQQRVVSSVEGLDLQSDLELRLRDGQVQARALSITRALDQELPSAAPPPPKTNPKPEVS